MRDLEKKNKILIFSYNEIVQNPKVSLLKLKKYLLNLNISINIRYDGAININKNFLIPKKIPYELSVSLKFMIKKYRLNNFLKKYKYKI